MPIFSGSEGLSREMEPKEGIVDSSAKDAIVSGYTPRQSIDKTYRKNLREANTSSQDLSSTIEATKSSTPQTKTELVSTPAGLPTGK